MSNYRTVDGTTQIDELTEVASALSERHRLRALALLRNGEACLCDLTENLGLSQSTVSNHMAILRRAGLVEARKDGRWMHFHLSDTAPDSVQAQALAWVLPLLPHTTSRTCSTKECCP